MGERVRRNLREAIVPWDGVQKGRVCCDPGTHGDNMAMCLLCLLCLTISSNHQSPGQCVSSRSLWRMSRENNVSPLATVTHLPVTTLPMSMLSCAHCQDNHRSVLSLGNTLTGRLHPQTRPSISRRFYFISCLK